MEQLNPTHGAASDLGRIRLSYQRYCDEIGTQIELARAAVAGADLTTPVPSCPGWNVGQLLRHLGGAHRWIESIVRTRASVPPADDEVRDLSGYADEDHAVFDRGHRAVGLLADRVSFG